MLVSKPCLILIRTNTIVSCTSDADLYETIENTKNYTDGMISGNNSRIAIFSDGSVVHIGDVFITSKSDIYRISHALASDDAVSSNDVNPFKESPSVRQFHIYHATGPDAFTPVEVQPRKYDGSVYAQSLHHAFNLAQKDEDWGYTGSRSTCVGDVIQDNDKFYMVTGSGFELLPSEEDRKNECELNGFENQGLE